MIETMKTALLVCKIVGNQYRKRGISSFPVFYVQNRFFGKSIRFFRKAYFTVVT